ncbi:MAG: hypothetical protein K2X99_04260 [Gemmatimonadaceae bacterium]|nr:hypothetical protein [Gemmatimonadaceae bacterium]
MPMRFQRLVGLMFACAALNAQEPTRTPTVRVARDAIRIHNADATRRVSGQFTLEAGADERGDLAVLNGPVTIAGRVRGTVAVVNGDIVLAPTAQIDGDVVVIGGGVSTEAGARVGGGIVQQPEVLRYRLEGTVIVPEGDAEEAGATRAERWRRWRERERRRGRADLFVTSAHTYNRVEGLPILAGPRVVRDGKAGRMELSLLGVLRTAGPVNWDRESVGHDASLAFRLGPQRRVGVSGRLYDVVSAVEEWQLRPDELGLASAFFTRDYADYFARHGARGGVQLFGGREVTLDLGMATERWGARAARDPWSLVDDQVPWRANPAVESGIVHLADARFSIDTRRREASWLSGWYVDAQIERGRGTLTPAGFSPLVDPLPGALLPRARTWSRGAIDLRRYNRLTPSAHLDVRVFLAGQLGADSMPLARRLSVGGPGTLPGYRFRGEGASPETFTCAPVMRAGMPAECDRVALVQAEFRSDFRSRVVRTDEDDDWWRPGLNARGSWVVFANAGRGWRVGTPAADWRFASGTIPAMSTWRADIGAGIDFGSIGVYAAKAVDVGGEPVRIFARARRRF